MNLIIIDFIIYLIKKPRFLEFIRIINKECEYIKINFVNNLSNAFLGEFENPNICSNM